MPISRATSTYLNLIRWLAASAVVFFHFQNKNFGPEWLTRYFPSNGHGYVIIFFVISGFVVSMVAEKKSATKFIIDRALRIYIVAIPVLLISTILSRYFESASTEYKEALTHPVLTFLLNATFLSESWTLSYPPFLDGQYWSLSYEVMYYLIFGLFVYTRGLLRWISSVLACAIAGPKIMVLFPCWLAGVVAYKYRNKFQAGTTTGWAVAIGAPLILITVFILGFKGVANELSNRFEFIHNTRSEGFVRSWIVAAAFAIHLWGICQVRIAFPVLVETAAHKLADMSYSLYLIHLPIIYMLAFWLGNERSFTFVVIAVPVVFSVSYFFSRATEANRWKLRSLIESAFSRLNVSRSKPKAELPCDAVQ
jgi:peptidoglycan/LPS O-acetylase OafA/YrhL